MELQGDFFEDTADQENTAREALVRRGFALTRERLPALARERGWPVSEDHCFMRILLDNVCGGVWREFVKSASVSARAALGAGASGGAGRSG